jgi:hypothetical protein
MNEKEEFLNRLIQSENETIREQAVLAGLTLVLAFVLFILSFLLPKITGEKDLKESWISFSGIVLGLFGTTKPVEEALKRTERIRNYKTLKVVFSLEKSEVKQDELFLKLVNKIIEK